MYVHGNPRTKKELKEWVKSGREVTLFAPGLGSPKTNGTEFVEGPQNDPRGHQWYAKVEVKDGKVIRAT